MSNYKTASQLKIRFNTSKGVLSTEQLWDLSLIELDSIAVELEKESKSTEKSFLFKKTKKDILSKLMFDIVLDVLTTRMQEAEALANAKEDKEHNEKILTLIANKNDINLQSKSIQELEEMLK